MQKYQNNVTARNGDAQLGLSVLITAAGTSTASTIYSDDGVTAAINPLTTDANGYFEFYAADGNYDIYVAGTLAYSDVLIADTVQLSAQVVRAEALAEDDGATLIGTPEGTVQAALDGRVKTSDLAAAGGSADVGSVASVTGAAVQTAQDRLDRFVRISDVDASVAALTRLQRCIDRASALKADVLVDVDLSIAGSATCPAGTRIRGAGGIITQTANLTPVFVCDGAGYREFLLVKCRGKQSDYVNNSTVYGAACVVASNGATVDVSRCEFLNFAGAGVRLLTTSINCRIRDTAISGAGPTYITGITFNYGGCIVVDNGITNWSVSGCDLSAAAQGIVTGDSQAHVRITGNDIHDISGQHGAYIESVGDLVVASNNIWNCGLTGMKVQIGTTLAPDAQRIVIASNVISNVGAQGILITNPVGGTPRLREFIVSLNTVVNPVSGGNAGIHLLYAIGAKVESNILQRAQRGLYLDSCSELDVIANRISNCLDEGIYITGVTDSNFALNVIRSPAGANNSATAWGIQVAGATSARLKFLMNDVSDQGAKMRAGFYLSAGDQSTCELEGNSFIDGQQYGVRLDSAQSIGKCRNNTAVGLLAPFLNFPVGFTTRGGVAQRYVSAAIPTSGVYQLGDEVMLPSPAASASPGWLVTTAGGAMIGLWATGATYAAGVWYRNSSGRVYKLVTAGGGTTSVQPTGTTMGATETGADGYVWLCMHTASARFATLPAVGTVAALP